MIKPKKSIKESIFISQMSTVLIALFLTAAVFTLCLRVYIRNQTKQQLITAGNLVKESLKADTSLLNFNKDVNNVNREYRENLVKVNRTLKRTQTFLDIDYAVVTKNSKVLYNSNEENEDNSTLEDKIFPVIEKRKRIKNNNVFFFNTSDKKYAGIKYQINLQKDKRNINLLIYSNLDASKRITSFITLMLFFIMLITAIIAVFISNSVSKKISRPITGLSKYAKKIGEREYSTETIKHDNDEIGQLAETMKIMGEKLKAYDYTMKTFLQNASHELRTPLMSIRGYAEGIKYGVVDSQDKAVDIIIEESERLSKLVEELLYLSKLDSMQEELDLEEINIENLLKSSIERVNGISVQNNKIINISLKESNINISGDEKKLTRAIINILSNCLKYAKEKILVKAEKERDKVLITIIDDGSGFKQNEIENVFQRFFKGEKGNYGLGLAITKSIIEMHGGSINAENNIEGGACFKIRI
ncbi:HAMP domain-containing sensor histidine kinase [Clostridium sediminicola]|uniref:sensor histidine kinase n=1 Tax=Clostridium sediminicola TaxID=3114879 RepID=UPI0031F22E03